MAAVLLRPPPEVDTCGFCGGTSDPRARARVAPGEAAVTFHPCPAQGGLLTPMLPAGVKGEVRVRLREEYVGAEAVQVDGAGRPVMVFETWRDDGQDSAVLCPTAHLDLRKDG